MELSSTREHDENQNHAHGATRTDLWAARKWCHTASCENDSNNAQPMQDLKHVACVDSPAYEPCLVLPWCLHNDDFHQQRRSVPYYDERFVGYGWIKIQLIHHLSCLGFSLWVVPAGFLVHVPHKLSEPSLRTGNLPDKSVNNLKMSSIGNMNGSSPICERGNIGTSTLAT